MQPTQNPVTEVEQTPADILRGAALYLQRHGWTQHHYYWRTPGKLPAACALGGVGMAVFGQALDNPQDIDLPGWPAFHAAYDVLNDYLTLMDLYGDLDEDDYLGQQTIGNWNDQDDQTAQQVIATLNAAAEHWDSHHTGGAQ